MKDEKGVQERTLEGKIFVKSSESFSRLLEIEHFINNELATQVFEKFKAGIRVHF